jgi:hypothetical protein
MSNNDLPLEKPWWLEQKEASLARKAKAAIRQESAQSGDAILIVTEGEVTEPVYFKQLRAHLKLSSVNVVVRPGAHSDPRQVILTAAHLAKDLSTRARRGMLGMSEPAKYDQVWAIIDTDVAVREGFWNDAVELARTKKVEVAHSTPCFEFWLLLHLTGFTTRQDLLDGDAAKAAVEKALGEDYSTNERTARKVMPRFVERWVDAVKASEKVRQYHRSAFSQSPAMPSTEVDRLACAMNDAAPLHARKIARTSA